MPWTLDTQGADFKRWDLLTVTEQSRWNSFRNAIATDGLHPKQAADQIRSADYKPLSGDQYQIRSPETPAPPSE
jgi:hypothetical protein